MKITCSKKNYGGAFDIDPYMFFTRDDLDELNESVLDHINETLPGNYSISDSYIDGDDNQHVRVEVTDSDQGTIHYGDAHIDMRKIRSRHDLCNKYALSIAAQIIDSIKEDRDVLVTGGTGMKAADTRLDAIKDKFYNAALDVMTSSYFGYDRDEAEDYVFVDVTNTDDGRIRIEVRAEVSYDGMDKMSEHLDALVAEIDSDAYFDYDEPGIMSAYVDVQSAIESATSVEGSWYDMLPGPGDYDPPEGPDTKEVPEVISYVEVEFDDEILVKGEDDWDFINRDTPWADNPDSRSGDWYCDESDYSSIRLCDGDDVLQAVYELLNGKIPNEPGKYRISGWVTLYFSITEIEYSEEYQGKDEDGDPIIERTYYTDDADVYHVSEKDELHDFKCVPISVESCTVMSSEMIFDIPEATTSPRYGMYTSTRYRGVEFSVHYTSVDTSPEADPMEMLHQFKAEVSEIHPYDEGDYFFARIENGVIYFAQNGKRPIKRSYYLNADDMELENYEWCDAVVCQAIEELRELNKSVESRMSHN